jgi:antitoxin HicB
MTNRFYPAVIVPLSEEDGGGFAAYAPDLKGCLSDGDTPEEALINLKDAVCEWIDEAKAIGRPVPEPGSGAVEAREARERIRAQAEAIEELMDQQQGRISKLRSDIHEIKVSIQRMMEQQDPTMWTGVPGVRIIGDKVVLVDLLH